MSYSSHGAPIASYAAPVVAKSLSPVVSYQSVSHAAPAIAYSSPLVAKSYAPALSYSSVAHAPAYVAGPSVSYSAPVVAKSISPVVSYSSPLSYAAGPVVAKAISPVGAPVLKSAIAYSAAPAVSHVAYSGLGVSYGW